MRYLQLLLPCDADGTLLSLLSKYLCDQYSVDRESLNCLEMIDIRGKSGLDALNRFLKLDMISISHIRPKTAAVRRICVAMDVKVLYIETSNGQHSNRRKGLKFKEKATDPAFLSSFNKLSQRMFALLVRNQVPMEIDITFEYMQRSLSTIRKCDSLFWSHFDEKLILYKYKTPQHHNEGKFHWPLTYPIVYRKYDTNDNIGRQEYKLRVSNVLLCSDQ